MLKPKESNIGVMKFSSNNKLAWIAIGFVLLANILLLSWIGVSLVTVVGAFSVQAIMALGGSALIHTYRERISDPVLFYLSGYCLGLIILYMSGFVWMHRGLLGTTPKWAALVSFAPLCVLAVVGLRQGIMSKSQMSPLRAIPLAIILTVSFFVTALATYGFDNNARRVKINQPEWRQNENMVPIWSWQGDRDAHYLKIVTSTVKDGFPPERVNHRGFHVSTIFVTLLTGEMSRPRFMHTYKSMAWLYFFMLAYGLYAIGRKLLDLGDRLSVFVASSALLFSPLKLPLFELSPTYRGFYSASGTLYHSDTQYTSTAISVMGLYLVLNALKTKSRTFFLGCAIIAGAFFLKPSNFMVLAPACYLFALICWKDWSRDRLAGLAILMAIPILWLSYLYFTGSTSSFDGVLGRDAQGNRGAVTGMPNMAIKIQFFAGYLPKLQGRFPDWMAQSNALMVLSMIFLSFAAFWAGGFTALKKTFDDTKIRPARVIQHMHTYAHIYFFFAFFTAAILLSSTLGEYRSKNINWKWSAAASYVLCIPLFAKGITLVKSPVLRRISWGLYGFQLMQGMGYLAYLFWYSKLI